MITFRIITLTATVAAATLVCTAGAAVGAPAPHAASVSIAVTSPVRIDQQEPPAAASFTGVSKDARVTVTWGDGQTSTKRGRCTAAAAKAARPACTVVLTHAYAAAGDYEIQAASGHVRRSATVSVVAAPIAWSPPAGWVQPAGWSSFGATFTPCENVTWFLDTAGQPADRAGVKADIAAVLTMLAAETRLTFTEVASRNEAQLVYQWRDLQGLGAGFTSLTPGGGKATVGLASDDPYTLDRHGGVGTVHFVYVADDGTYEGDVPGRAWLIMRLTGMALGLMPVTDPAQAMYQGYFGPGALGSGDRDGLHTMYANLACPVIPD